MRIAAYAIQLLIRKPCYTQQSRTYTNMAAAINKTAHPFNKQQLESVLTQRFFYAPAFEIYGGAYYRRCIIHALIYIHLLG